MVGLVVRNLTAPEHEDDLQPLGSQRAHGVVMAVPALPTAIVVGARPYTFGKRWPRELLGGLAHVQIAREAELDARLFAAALGDRHTAGVPLQMAKALPAAGRITQFRVQGRHGCPAQPPRQGLGPASSRHAAEKIGDRLPILLHVPYRHLELL